MTPTKPASIRDSARASKTTGLNITRSELTPDSKALTMPEPEDVASPPPPILDVAHPWEIGDSLDLSDVPESALINELTNESDGEKIQGELSNAMMQRKRRATDTEVRVFRAQLQELEEAPLTAHSASGRSSSSSLTHRLRAIGDYRELDNETR